MAARGNQAAVSTVVSTMGKINEGSSRIAEIIGIIDSIAFQTNIHALNAAVEAARAGEQGRGFAVVASEVRALAQRSPVAAKEIRTLIDASIARVQTGSQQADEAGSTMQEVIAAASDEQIKGIDQVEQAITQRDDVTRRNTALVEEAAAAAQSLDDQAAKLKAAVTTFRLQDSQAPSRNASRAGIRPLCQPQGTAGAGTIPWVPAMPIAGLERHGRADVSGAPGGGRKRGRTLTANPCTEMTPGHHAASRENCAEAIDVSRIVVRETCKHADPGGELPVRQRSDSRAKPTRNW
ncbi:methyl-accepting chemotaxis protein [Burkholderia pseudomallei]|uniref:methyl-accepting chemotaxis protein n=1 Tax=Burkholderia pseudomallei TaxID=28450 RepID=UPI003BF5714A